MRLILTSRLFRRRAEPDGVHDVVVNVGTVASGEAAVPRFSIQASNLSPAVNEPIELTVLPDDGT